MTRHQSMAAAHLRTVRVHIRYPYVVYLDTDLGQPEFTPTGLVSLHVISSPVFGPSFAHLATPIKFVSPPLGVRSENRAVTVTVFASTRAYFMGDSSVEEVLEPYSQAVCFR
jgi:hypothetical protein